MTQAQLDYSVASATGETLRTIHALGFNLVARSPDDLEPEDDLQLVITCPFCRKSVPYPGLAGDGALPMAECLTCDVDFPFDADEVFASGTIGE
jgi:hypothetical protein